jgi:hypothetical protein
MSIQCTYTYVTVKRVGGLWTEGIQNCILTLSDRPKRTYSTHFFRKSPPNLPSSWVQETQVRTQRLVESSHYGMTSSEPCPLHSVVMLLTSVFSVFFSSPCKGERLWPAHLWCKQCSQRRITSVCLTLVKSREGNVDKILLSLYVSDWGGQGTRALVQRYCLCMLYAGVAGQVTEVLIQTHCFSLLHTGESNWSLFKQACFFRWRLQAEGRSIDLLIVHLVHILLYTVGTSVSRVWTQAYFV